jgi:mannose-1-phosphate guanylyltransferase/mannose-6-phosphate isomerase
MMALALRLGDTILVMPSDHAIGNPGKLISAIDKARAAVRQGHFVTFGITPSGPETSYGYIRQGAQLAPGADAADHIGGIYHVERFVEKPPRDKAEAMLAEGGYLWNSGMFLFPVDTLLAELNRLQPATLRACQQALSAARIEGRVVHPEPSAFSGAEAISIDYAVMEKTTRAAVVPTDPLWNDVGSWTSVWQLSDRDQSQNVTIGDVILHDVSGAYVRSEGPLTAVVGLSDVIVVNTGDAVIVAAKSHAQEIRRIAEAVKRRRAEAVGPTQASDEAGALDPAVEESLADIVTMPRRTVSA